MKDAVNRKRTDALTRLPTLPGYHRMKRNPRGCSLSATMEVLAGGAAATAGGAGRKEGGER